MTSFHDITTDQLRQMIHLKERIEFLQALLERVRGEGAVIKTAGQTPRLAKYKNASKNLMPVKLSPKKK